jgi:hypothetical protein
MRSFFHPASSNQHNMARNFLPAARSMNTIVKGNPEIFFLLFFFVGSKIGATSPPFASTNVSLVSQSSQNVS